MKKYIFAFFLSVFSLGGNVFAQEIDEMTKPDDLIDGTKEQKDSIYWLFENGDKGSRSLLRYRADGGKAQNNGDVVEALENYEKYHELWLQLLEKAPLYNLKRLYVEPLPILRYLIDNTEDIYTRKVYYADLMTLFETRKANLRELNIMNQNSQTTLASITMNQAYWYYASAFGVYREDPQQKINFEKAYNMFKEGVNVILEEGGSDVPASVLKEYIELSYILLEKDREKYKENFLTDYQACLNLTDSMMNMVRDPEWGKDVYAYEEDRAEAIQKIIDEYDPVKVRCDELFTGSHVGDSATIVGMLAPKIEADKNNIDKLCQYLNILADNDLDTVPCYYLAGEYAYRLRPTYQAAISSARKMMLEGNLNGAIQRYNEAIGMADENSKKAGIAMRVAKSLMNANRESEAIKYYHDAASYDPKVAGRCYLTLGKLYGKKQQFGKARDYLSQVASKDATLSAEADRVREQVDKNEENFIKFNQDRKEYLEAIKKKQEEEDFWNKGKDGSKKKK